MRQHIHTAIDREGHTVQILRMCKDRHGVSMCLRDGGLGNGQGQDCNLTPALVRAGKQLDAICAFRCMITHQRDCLIDGFGGWDRDVVLVQKVAHVHRFDRPNRLTDGEKVWSAKLFVLDSTAEREGVVQY